MAQPKSASMRRERQLASRFFKGFSKEPWEQKEFDKRYEELKQTAVQIARFAHEQKVDCLIGNDVGGRPAALLVKHVYEQLYGGPIKLFFANFRKWNFEEPTNVKVVPGTKALFVDECVATGRSTVHAREYLEKNGAKILVATFSLHKLKDGLHRVSKFKLDFVGGVRDSCFPIQRNFQELWFKKILGYDWGVPVERGVVTRFEYKGPRLGDRKAHTESLVKTALKHGIGIRAWRQEFGEMRGWRPGLRRQKTAVMFQRRINDYRTALKQVATEAVEQYKDKIQTSSDTA